MNMAPDSRTVFSSVLFSVSSVLKLSGVHLAILFPGDRALKNSICFFFAIWYLSFPK
jgi:hypothetical protein